MSLRLIYKSGTSVPVEVEGLLPERLCGLSLPEIERQTVALGNRREPLAELFSVAGDPTDGQLDLEGDLSGVHRIGAGLQSGIIRVHGSAGRHAGSEMSGGRIEIRGDAGDWLGAEMHGGAIHVLGNTGDGVGAAYRGAARGMTGGSIAIEGDAGHEAGAAMRRGLIAIGGKAGQWVGVNMLAGSILLFAGCGPRPGANMRRGTIAMLGGAHPELLPTFRHACRYRPTFLPLILSELDRDGFQRDPSLGHAAYDIYHGDMLELGRGEILVQA